MTVADEVEEIIKAIEFRTVRSIEHGHVDSLGKVYVIGYGSYVKIGFTERTVKGRVNNLKTGIPEEVQVYAVLPGVKMLERALHRHFKKFRLEGEWFRNEGELADWIARGCPTGNRQIRRDKQQPKENI